MTVRCTDSVLIRCLIRCLFGSFCTVRCQGCGAKRAQKSAKRAQKPANVRKKKVYHFRSYFLKLRVRSSWFCEFSFDIDRHVSYADSGLMLVFCSARKTVCWYMCAHEPSRQLGQWLVDAPDGNQ